MYPAARRDRLPISDARLSPALVLAALADGAPPRPRERPLAPHTIEVDGLTRTYHLHVPPALGPAPAPLVLVFHGGGGNGPATERLTRFTALADREGFLVAFPEGVEKNWNDGREFARSRAHRDHVDDVAFVAALLDAIRRAPRGRPAAGLRDRHLQRRDLLALPGRAPLGAHRGHRAGGGRHPADDRGDGRDARRQVRGQVVRESAAVGDTGAACTRRGSTAWARPIASTSAVTKATSSTWSRCARELVNSRPSFQFFSMPSGNATRKPSRSARAAKRVVAAVVSVPPPPWKTRTIFSRAAGPRLVDLTAAGDPVDLEGVGREARYRRGRGGGRAGAAGIKANNRARLADREPARGK